MATAPQFLEIPLLSTPQTLQVSLVGKTYAITVRWNAPAQIWVIDLQAQDGSVAIDAVPLVTGADLLEQYGYLGIGGALVVQTDHDTLAAPTFSNLGVTAHLYFVPSPA